jgi:predicted N-acetyltransferase YhbS
MPIIYRRDTTPEVQQVIELYASARMPRPLEDVERMRRMFENSDLIFTAWDGDVLVGVSRCITDWVWCCYLADLAVRPEYQKSGIGRRLIQLTKDAVGDLSMVLLLSVPSAMEYYPRVGFTKKDNSFLMDRSR